MGRYPAAALAGRQRPADLGRQHPPAAAGGRGQRHDLRGSGHHPATGPPARRKTTPPVWSLRTPTWTLSRPWPVD